MSGGIPEPLDLSELDEWIADLQTALPALKSATREPGDLILPGLLVQVVGLGVDTLDHSWRVDLSLVIVTGENDVVRAMDDLVARLNDVRAYLGYPAGDFLPRTYRNDQGQDLPALSFPHTVRITQEA